MVGGEGAEEKRARQLTASLAVADHIDSACGSRAELDSAYRAAPVVLVPSRPTQTWVEQFGRVIVEAPASGAARWSQVTERFDPGGCRRGGGGRPDGWCRPTGRGIARVVSDRDKFGLAAQHGRRQAATRTWLAVAVRQRALYQAVLADERAGRAAAAALQKTGGCACRLRADGVDSR